MAGEISGLATDNTSVARRGSRKNPRTRWSERGQGRSPGFLVFSQVFRLTQNSALRTKELFGNHPRLPGVVEKPAGINDRPHVAERLEVKNLAGVLHGHGGGIKVHSHDLAGLQDLAKAFGGFARIELAGGDAVAEENAGEALGQHDP